MTICHIAEAKLDNIIPSPTLNTPNIVIVRTLIPRFIIGPTNSPEKFVTQTLTAMTNVIPVACPPAMSFKVSPKINPNTENNA